MRVALRLFPALVLAACGAPPPMGGPSLTLGTADQTGAFAPLTDGQDVTLVEGAQGGFHVWMSFRAEGVAPQSVTLVRTAHRLSDDAPVLRTMSHLDVGAAGPDGSWEVPNALPMFMCPTPIGVRIEGQPIVYEMQLLDDKGVELTKGSITLVPHCPTDNHTFCMSICTG